MQYNIKTLCTTKEEKVSLESHRVIYKFGQTFCSNNLNILNNSTEMQWRFLSIIGEIWAWAWTSSLICFKYSYYYGKIKGAMVVQAYGKTFFKEIPTG
jgi:hypothetical protein